MKCITESCQEEATVKLKTKDAEPPFCDFHANIIIMAYINKEKNPILDIIAIK